MNRTKTFLEPLLAALFLSLLGTFPHLFAQESSSDGIAQAQMISRAFRDAAREVLPSVVKIVVMTGTAPVASQEELLPFSELLLDLDHQNDICGIGSGILVDPKGIVLTNEHVVTDSKNILVELHDGRQFRVLDIKKDKTADLAILRLDSKETLPALGFADSDALEIGDWVIAVGNPFMLDSSVSAGIISAKGRSLHDKDEGSFIQTDAAINPGNSGGPLVNLKGEVVGVNTAIASISGGYQGVGFAIPSNTALWVMRQLIDRGKVERAFLGAKFVPIPLSEASRMGLGPRKGVKVGIPDRNSPAAKAGLKSGDYLLAFDEKPIDNTETLRLLVEMADIHVPHQLTLLRKGQNEPQKVLIWLEYRPENYVGVPQSEKMVSKGEHFSDKKLGLMLIPLTADSAARLRIDAENGLIILSATPGTIAWNSGFRDGMCIVQIDSQPVSTVDQFASYVSDEALERGLSVEVIARGERRSLTLKK